MRPFDKLLLVRWKFTKAGKQRCPAKHHGVPCRLGVYNPKTSGMARKSIKWQTWDVVIGIKDGKYTINGNNIVGTVPASMG